MYHVKTVRNFQVSNLRLNYLCVLSMASSFASKLVRYVAYKNVY